MTIVLGVALAVLVVALVLAVVVAHKRGQAHDALEAEHLEAEKELVTRRDEVAATSAERDELAAALAAAQERGEGLERERAEAEAAAAARAADLEQARVTLAETQARLNVRRAGELDPESTWLLELARVEREWRNDGAPSPDVPSPLEGAADPLAVAVQMRADCLRETVGFASTIEWTARPPEGPATALAWFRVADELLVQASRQLDDTTLDAHDDDETGQLVLTLTGPPMAGGGVLADAVAVAGGEVATTASGDDDRGDVVPSMVVRLVRPEPPEPPSEEPPPD